MVMPQPYDYSGGFAPQRPVSILDNVMKYRQGQQQQQVFDAKMEAMNRQKTKAVEFDKAKKAMGENPTVDQYKQLFLDFPEASTKFRAVYEPMQVAEKKDFVGRIKKIEKAIDNGRVDFARDIAQEAYDANLLGKNEERTKQWKTAVDEISKYGAKSNWLFKTMLATAGEEGEDIAKYELTQAQTGLASAQEEEIKKKPGQKAAEIALKKKEHAQKVTEFNTKKGLDEAKLAQLPPDVRQSMNKSTKKAVDSYSVASKAINLADKYDQLVKTNGLFGRAISSVRKAAGGYTLIEEAQQEYKALKAKGIVSNLPPGVASDKDIEMVASGWPGDDAPSEQLASFLRGMAKLQKLEGMKAEARVEWLDLNRTDGKLKEDATIMGVPVEKGTTYLKFLRTKQGDLLNSIEADTAPEEEEESQDLESNINFPMGGGEPTLKIGNVTITGAENIKKFQELKAAEGL